LGPIAKEYSGEKNSIKMSEQKKVIMTERLFLFRNCGGSKKILSFIKL
jgi:hypothetical protein